MKKIFLLFLIIISLKSFSQSDFSIIPAPVSLTPAEGYFQFDNTTYLLANDFESFKDASSARYLFIQYYQLPIKVATKKIGEGKQILVKYDSTLNIPDEGYELIVTENAITITGKNKGGVSHGLMSLLQLIENPTTRNYKIPCCKIIDYPRFSYRGMHLDCARHFFDVDFIKKYIDYLALYKYNTFHWHLTDDQGWRIEIKQYPKLTEIGAWRNGNMIGHYREQQFDTIRYGGYYTQKEIKEIIKYAEARNITIIPEIEMPGHCLAALASYPDYGCVADTTYEVGKAWGVYPDVFCPKEETFIFLENILSEVIELFPSEYIHIGGDEVEKIRWKNSAFCQQLMKGKNLKDENELQSYFIQRIEKYVNSKGKKLIGWDEILEGGIAPNATIMSWRGEEGGIKAAQQNHFAIMTPSNYCYFDHYQGSPQNEPLAIGGYTPIEKVYSYEPIPAQLSVEEAKYILGAQGNVWTEYIAETYQVEYMAIPRMLALSEVLWSQKEKKDFYDFADRLLLQFELLRRIDCNFSTSIFDIKYKILPAKEDDGLYVELTGLKNFQIAYQFLYPKDESFKIYTTPFKINSTSIIYAHLDHEYYGQGIEFKLKFNRATGKKISLTNPSSNKYSGDGPFTLVNGVDAITWRTWRGNEWLGFEGINCEAIIDLGKEDTISIITVGYLEDKMSWIWIPNSIEIFISDDGKNFTPVNKINSEDIKRNYRNIMIGTDQENPETVNGRFVKIKIENYGIIPSGNPGAGNKAWLFVDEISIE
ncbi:MAG: family 20 glycosylhydrolase [Fimbriimonadaceae bacterium]|nr:family 20 glycosylhydrolase [Chitinophagales bacterium]